MRLFGNAIQNYYGQLTIQAPASGGAGLTILSNTSQMLITATSFAGGAVNINQNTNNGTTSTIENKIENDAGSILSCVLTSSTFAGVVLTGAAAGKAAGLYTTGAYPIYLAAGGLVSLACDTAGNVNVPNGGGTLSPVYAGAPQNFVAGTTYTTVLSDANKSFLLNNAGTKTLTIAANASVAYPIGTIITIVNAGLTGAATIAITTDTMQWSPSGSTGSRTLAAYGVATLIKIVSNVWVITGTGLT